MRRATLPQILAACVALLAASPAQAGFAVKGSPPGAVTITQTFDSGFLIVRVGDDDLTVSEGLGQLFPGVPKSIKVVMLPGAGGPLIIDLDQALPGNLDLRVPDVGEVDFIGDVNHIGGSLKIKAGDGGTTVDLGVNGPMSIAKSLLVDLGSGDDTFRDGGNDVTVQLGAKLVGADLINIQGDLSVGKSLFVNGKKDEQDTWTTIGGGLVVGGNAKILGGPRDDDIELGGNGAGTDIGGNLLVNLGGVGPGPVQEIVLTDGARVGGKLSVKANDEGQARLEAEAGTTIGKNVAVRLPNAGGSTVHLRGQILGKSVKVTTGAGPDLVTLQSNAVTLKAKLGAESDTLNLGDFLVKATVDFGPGPDTLNHPPGISYPIKARNLP